MRLLAFVPKAPLSLAAPVETECAVVDDELPKPKHLCAECVHCNEQPGCRDRLTKGEILFNGDNPDAEVLECVKFEPVSSDVQTSSGETNQAENGTEGTENGTPGAPDETVAHGRKKSSSRKKSGKKAA